MAHERNKIQHLYKSAWDSLRLVMLEQAGVEPESCPRLLGREMAQMLIDPHEQSMRDTVVLSQLYLVPWCLECDESAYE